MSDPFYGLNEYERDVALKTIHEMVGDWYVLHLHDEALIGQAERFVTPYVRAEWRSDLAHAEAQKHAMSIQEEHHLVMRRDGEGLATRVGRCKVYLLSAASFELVASGAAKLS